MNELLKKSSKLPKFRLADENRLKSILNGDFYLKVVQVVDISKPSQDMSNTFLDLEDEVEEQDDQEEDRNSEDYNAKKLKGRYAAAKGANRKDVLKKGPRMIQLEVKDDEGTLFKALEVVPIDKLTGIKAESVIQLRGPMQVRCSNILLENHNVVSVHAGEG